MDGRKSTRYWPVVPATATQGWFATPRWLIAFFGLAMVLTMPSCPEATTDEAPQQLYVRDVSNGIHDIAPVRGERGPLRLHRDGDEYECSMCHDGFEGDLGEEALKGEHSDITFSHGLNLLCLNCHHSKNSDVFVYHDGSEIPGDKPTELCAKCHGPHYREWRMAVHGRENAYWDGEKVQRKKLDCIQCHNPHHPRFELMRPERPPVHTRFDLEAGGAHHDEE